MMNFSFPNEDLSSSTLHTANLSPGCMLDPMRSSDLIEEVCTHMESVKSEIESGPIYPCVEAAEIRRYLSVQYLFQEKKDLHEIVADVERMMRTWQVQITHPHYLGLFNPDVTPASVIADTLAAIYNPQLANWRTSPAANEIERHTLSWLTAKFGLPSESIATFTSGGTEANLSAIVAALTRAFPDYGDRGVRSLPGTPVIYLTQESHNGYYKLAHIAGLGRDSIRVVPVDHKLRMDVNTLRSWVEADRLEGFLPFMVVGTAGTTATGVIDPLSEIAAFCRESNLWFHADAAWGGAAAISPRLRPYLNGIEEADSITCDAHKWLSVPMGAGMFFCRHPQYVSAAFRTGQTYMPNKLSEPVYDPLLTSIQWSRRFIGLKLFMALAQYGESGYISMIEHQTRMGDLLRNELIAFGWRILNSTPLPLVCFTQTGVDIQALLALMKEEQVAWMTAATVHGVPAIRACITNYNTSEQDIRWIVRELGRLAATISTR